MPSHERIPAVARFYGLNDTIVEVALHEPASGSGYVPEALVHDIWERRQFDASSLRTTLGESITVYHPGVRNTDTGPDFLGARLRIGEVTWCGDVEIHVAPSDWFNHRHHLDPRYNRVVLHVSLREDPWTGALVRSDGSAIYELVLTPFLQDSLRRLIYEFCTRPRQDILCAPEWTRLPVPLREGWIEAMATERLYEKRERLASLSSRLALDEVLHQLLFTGLGYAKNSEAMAGLAYRIPLSVTRLLADTLDLEALHLGVAGLIPPAGQLLRTDRATCDYVMALQDRFAQLQHRFAIPVMDPACWQFFRLRPANFPTLRIAQGVMFLKPGGLLRTDPIQELAAAFSSRNAIRALRNLLTVTPDSFWNRHVRLDRLARRRSPKLGRQRIDALLVNAAAPVMLLYAANEGDKNLETRVTDVLRKLPADKDEITSRFAALNSSPSNAFIAQGQHHLYRTRCEQTRCLTCPIGTFLLDRQT